jgi:hypothetical protein
MELEHLLNTLSLYSKDDGRAKAQFKCELNNSSFEIFTPLSDHGYFSWKPIGSYTDLSNIMAISLIADCIKLDECPKDLVDTSRLELPIAFESLPPQDHENKFPYGRYDIASLYVASQHRGVNLDEVDFSFGGSTLEMLARKNASGPYMATRVPHSGTILVVKCKDYVQNYADFGYQFERLVTGLSFSDRPGVEFVEHLHVMMVGSHRVLFRAETDALYDGEPIEVKASKPRNWGTKVMFQMISSGSPNLCHGVKEGEDLVEINVMRLSEVVQKALLERSHATLEANILEGMVALKSQLVDAKDGEVFKVSFSDGSLRVELSNTESDVLLPPANIVQKLLVG